MEKGNDNVLPFAELQCRSFYAAYQSLREKAFAPLHTSDKAPEIHYIIPCMVNGVFAAELAIKLLLMHQNISFARVHELVNLLLLLPDDLLAEFYAELKSRLSTAYTAESISRGLFHISNAFQEWRYIYEAPNAPIDIAFTDAFVSAICSVAIRHHGGDFSLNRTHTESDPDYSTIDQRFIENEKAHYEAAVDRLRKIQKKQTGDKK